MALPIKALPTATVVVEGTNVDVRGLSRSEALKLSTNFTAATAEDAEIFIVVCGTGVSEDEAREWLGSTDATTAGIVIDKIVELSGLSDTGKPDPKSNTKE